MASSKLTQQERTRRKREAARLRQQRCRARKRAEAEAQAHNQYQLPTTPPPIELEPSCPELPIKVDRSTFAPIVATIKEGHDVTVALSLSLHSQEHLPATPICSHKPTTNTMTTDLISPNGVSQFPELPALNSPSASASTFTSRTSPCTPSRHTRIGEHELTAVDAMLSLRHSIMHRDKQASSPISTAHPHPHPHPPLLPDFKRRPKMCVPPTPRTRSYGHGRPTGTGRYAEYGHGPAYQLYVEGHRVTPPQNEHCNNRNHEMINEQLLMRNNRNGANANLLPGVYFYYN